MMICEYPEYWYNIIDHLNKNKIRITIQEIVEPENFKNNHDLKEYLHKKELYWIDKFKPDSQKCDGKTDNIRNINLRQFKINI